MLNRRSIVRARLAALMACSLIATTAPFSVLAAQVDPATGEWVDPATTTSTTSKDSVDPATAVGAEPVPVEPLADPTLSDAAVDPTIGQLVEPAPVDAGPVHPAPAIEPASAESAGPVRPEPAGQSITTAYITNTGGDGAPCLAAPEWGTETLTVLGDGQPIEVRAETRGEWQPVNCAGVGGYVHAALIAWAPVSAPSAAIDESGRQGPKVGSDSSGVGGEQIVNFALQYQGYPYVYAGEGPYAFDCSGFTMFVINNTVGIPIPHDMAVQFQMGQSVSREALQPGDLVFFANTFRPGMSHNGIYIGGGQFVHAETEASGVTISDLNAEYYSSRWYGAVRFSE
jgi:cell wall-associated NlpC family hydrolase